MQNFYFHDAATTIGGTLPATGSSQSATTPSVTATGAGTNRSMDSTIGSLQASGALTSLAQLTTQSNWYRRFVSPALAAQTIAAGNWLLALAIQQSNTSGNLNVPRGVLYAWRPSTGAKVGNIVDDVAAAIGTTDTVTTELAEPTSGPGMTVAGSAVTVQAGDVLIYEYWTVSSQSATMAYTLTVFYDGTTEFSGTSNAAFVKAPVDLAMQPAAAALRPKQLVVGQAVARAATR
jgi:hypothetical protein